MFRKIKKVFCCSMILSLVVSSLAFAASLPNYYGKNYTYTKSKTIATMEAEGNGNTASTTVTNIAKSKRYYSAYVIRRYADSNRVIEKSAKETTVASGNKISVAVARYRSTENREHYHKAMSWNCSMQPSGNGYTAFLADTIDYTIKQSK